MSLAKWFRTLIASEPTSFSFVVANPNAEGTDSVTSFLTPGTPESPDWVVSVDWTKSEEKMFEKRFPDEVSANHTFKSINEDLQEVAQLTSTQKMDEAKNLLNNISEKYKTTSEEVVEGNPAPLTHTMAQKKEAKVVMQNLFFSTPEEAMDYQKKMQALSPDKGNDGALPGFKDLGQGQNTEETPMDEMAPASLSYEDVEKQKAEDTKNLDKRIETEVKDQIQSALEKKIATLFDETDDALVEAMRGKGRTWEEIKDYFLKAFKYDKDTLTAYIDEKRGVSETPAPLDETPMPGLDEKPQAPKPPKETVSPETHEKLLDEVNEIPKQEMQEIAKQDGEIKKVALDPNPLQQAPVLDTPPQEAQPSMEQGMDNPDAEPTDGVGIGDYDDVQPSKGDFVYVMHDYSTNSEGFKGKLIEEFKSKGDNFGSVEDEHGELHEVPMHRIVKADMSLEADRIRIEGASNSQVIDMFIDDTFPKDKMPEWGTPNLKIKKEPTGWSLVNYTTPLMFRSNEGKLYFNVNRYSVTTSKIQSYIRGKAEGQAEEVNENDIRSLISPKAPAPLTDRPVNPKKQQIVQPEKVIDVPEPTASKELTSIKAELETLSKEMEREIEADALEVVALPTEPDVRPVDFKHVKVAPPHTDREKALPATPEIEKVFSDIKGHEQHLAHIKTLVTDLQNKYNEAKKQMEESNAKIPHEAELKAKIDRLATLISASENQLVELGDEVVSFKQETKTVPVKWDAKTKLEKILSNPDFSKKVSEYLERAENGAQNAATTEITRELRVFPKLSKLHRKASLMETLDSVANDLMKALELLMGGGMVPQTEVI